MSTSTTKPTTWPSKIDAPQAALEFYALLAKIANTQAFETCHVFDGPVSGKVPVIRWQGKTTALPRVIAGFLALPHGRKLCNTKGCCNPLHYLAAPAPSPDAPDATLVSTHVPIEQVRHPDQSDYNEMVEYAMDRAHLKNPTFEQLRELLPMLDIDDARLLAAIGELDKAVAK